MKQYDVTGMTCAACSARVEKAVSKVPGVTSCSVNLLTNSMGVEGTASSSDIIAAVTNAGYGASVKGAKPEKSAKSPENVQENAFRSMKHRLIASLVFLVILMYFSMGHMMWGFPLPPFLEGNHTAMGLIQLLLTAAVMVINQRFFISGFRSLVRGAPNMDTLVALGASAAFGYSTAALFAMTDAQLHGGAEAAMPFMDEFYFESAAMILTLITVGKMLEARSKGKTTDALKSLMKLAPSEATVIRGGEELTIPAEQLAVGDIFAVKPGESIPADGVVIEGSSAVNESALTGEGLPVDKSEGSKVSAATINQSGYLRCRAEKVGGDTALSKIIQMVSDASATKAPIAKLADKVSGVFVPVVIGIALVTIAVWLLCGQTVGYSLARGISVLVISCPCALGLATPVAIMVGNGMGAKNGILFKTAVSLEETGKVSIVALDKTGTITKGEPAVTDVIPAAGVTRGELLSSACALESRSEHPLASAVMAYCSENGAAPQETEEFTALPGSGLSAKLNGSALLGGSVKFISENSEMPEELRAETDRLSAVLCPRRKAARSHRRSGRYKARKPRSREAAPEHGHTCGNADRRQRAHREGGRSAGGCRRSNSRSSPGRQGSRDTLPEGAGQGSDGRRRNKRRPRPYPRGYRHSHRSRHGYRDRRGGRGPDEQPSHGRTGGGAAEPRFPAEHQGEPVLGVHLQHDRYTAGGGRVRKPVRLEP